jgi:plastocyanin
MALALLPVLGSCSGSPVGTDSVAPAHDVEILQNAPQLGPNAFSPGDAVISLASQDSVTWYNGDLGFYGGGAGTVHRLVADDGLTFESDPIAPNHTFRATFTAPGTYTYHCEIHPGMTGTVTVNP